MRERLQNWDVLIAAVVFVLLLSDAAYQEQRFQAQERMVSPTFPDLNLTAEQVLKAGK